jgi:uncharacterized coiled-coil protein SlyX
VKRLFLASLLALAIALPSAAAERIEFPGGRECELQPNGAYVALIWDSHFDTSFGRVTLPNQNVVYHRLNAAGTAFAGQGHSDGHAWEFKNGVWSIVDQLALGVSPVIYDGLDTLRVSHGEVGSQGFRYVDQTTGRIFTGDETYADLTNKLWESTTLGDVQCGQGGDEEGLQCIVRGKRVLVEPGVNRFVRFNRQGDNLAICSAKLAEGKAVGHRLTVAELFAKPTYEVPGTVVVPPPPPPPPPPPVQHQDPPNRSSVVNEVAAANRHLFDGTRESGREFCRLVVERLREEDSHWGLNWKRGMVGDQSADVIAYRFDDGTVRLVDIIVAFDDANPDARRPSWGVIGVEEAGTTGWFWSGATPPPPPPTDPRDKKIADLEAQLAAQAAEITEANRRIAVHEITIKQQLAEIERLRAVPEKACEVTGPGWLVRLLDISCVVRNK